MLKPNHTKQEGLWQIYSKGTRWSVMTVVLVADLKLWISGTGANANAIAIHYSGFYTPYVFIIFSTSTGAWEIYRSTNRVETHPKPPANLPRTCLSGTIRPCKRRNWWNWPRRNSCFPQCLQWVGVMEIPQLRKGGANQSLSVMMK